MTSRKRWPVVAVRATQWAMSAGLATILGTTAFAQDVRVAVQDAYGFLLPNASVRWQAQGGPWVKAEHEGDGTATLHGAANKLLLDVEHPYYGHRQLEVSVPSDDHGVLVVSLDSQSTQTKFKSSRMLVTPTGAINNAGNGVSCSTGVGCQLPDQQGHGGSGTLAATSDLNPAAGFRVAESVSTTSAGSIGSVCWWGIYFNFGSGTDCGPGPGDQFSITYYNDDAGGTVPGSVRAGPFSVTAVKSATGNVVCAGTTCIAEWQFEASHAPVAVGAGECVWVEIANNTQTGNCFWLWSAAPGGDGRSAQATGASYAATDFDLAFCVDVAIAPDGCGAPPPPANDACIDAIAIAGTGSFAYDNTAATTDGPGHVECNFSSQTGIDRDLWWCWTAPANGDYEIATCSLTGTDSKLAVYDGCGCPVSAPIACNDDSCGLQSSLTVTAVAGQSYMIRVGVFPGAAGGSGGFSITSFAIPTNDLCADAIPVAVPSVTTGTTDFATIDTNAPTCIVGPTSPGVWYSVVGTGNVLTAELCDGAATFDTKLTVYCGNCASLTCIDGNDDSCGLQSSVTWCSQLGGVYLILVHGFGGESGPFDLTITDTGVGCTATQNCAPVGACCVGSGCMLVDAATCAALGGQFQGAGTDCGTVQYTASTCTQQWEDISLVGTQLFLGDDDGVFIPLTFPFSFHGVAQTQVGIGSNGYLSFGTVLDAFSNQVLPDANDPNDVIAPFWDDLDPTSGGAIYYNFSGTAPNRALVVSWIGVPQFNTGDSNTFQAILFENSSRISFRYLGTTPEAFAGDYTVGVENATGSAGTSVPGSTLSAGLCLSFDPDTTASDCPANASIDITPGTCPNPFNPDSRGALLVSLAGTPVLDVTNVDFATLYLVRTDRVGVAVAPYLGPPGPHSMFEDRSTPFYGPATHCHAAGADGLLDVSLYFRAVDVVDAFELDTVAFGTQVPVMLTGRTLDGRWFQGEDSLTLVPPPSSVNLRVHSSLSDAFIEVSPRDLVTDGDGWAPFERWFAVGTTVTLTATPDPIAKFVGWRVNGQFLSGSTTIHVDLSQTTDVWALYGMPRSSGSAMGGVKFQ
ncbi:MAG: hypothetical protein IT453_18580 [Planctomycetes bacterium]|nr:hypothetical protein [Planctomycetota bacterium]